MTSTRPETSATGRRLRSARNRLIDLLSLGETYPLRDLPVRDERLTVSVKDRAKIPVETSERAVTYAVEPRADGVPGTPGTGDLMLIETPEIDEDIAFTIRASVQRTGREARLWSTAEVKVGLDTTLDADLLPLVAPEPRIVDFGTPIDVVVWQSQEGVDYRLVHDPAGRPPDDRRNDLSRYVNLSKNDTPVRGIGPTQTDDPSQRSQITLPSLPLSEDTWILVRADKKFDPAEGRPDRAAVLDADFPMLVRANRALAVSVTPSPIVDYKGAPRIRIAGSQASARYRAHARPVVDGAVDGVSLGYRHGPGAWPDIIRVPVSGADEDAQIVGLPPAPGPWDAPAGFSPVSDFVAGTGGDITISLTSLSGAALTDDMLVVIEAEKQHRLADDSTFVSAVRLDQTVAILVRPDPQIALRLEVPVRGGTTTGELRVFDGQPGVFYRFSVAADRDAVPAPAYFHKRFYADPHDNKGVGQLAVGIDFVVARDDDADPAPPATPGVKAAPAPPVLATKPLPADVVLAVRAVKAQTGVAIDLTPRTPNAVAAPVPDPGPVPPPAPPVDPVPAVTPAPARGFTVINPPPGPVPPDNT